MKPSSVDNNAHVSTHIATHITTHILDTALGKPAAGVAARLFVKTPSEYLLLAEGNTDDDGRVKIWSKQFDRVSGHYRIEFDVAAYFESLSLDYFYPEVRIDFKVVDPQQHYHVPLLISPFGFSTYRGS